MQSGMAGRDEWILDFEPAEARRADPLMGWSGSADTQTQVRLRFATREEAVAYAEKGGLAYDIELPADPPFPSQGLCRQFPLRPARKTGRTEPGVVGRRRSD